MWRELKEVIETSKLFIIFNKTSIAILCYVEC